MSAKIFQFRPRSRSRGKVIEFLSVASDSAAAPEDRAMDHVDPVPREYVRPGCFEGRSPDE